MSTLSVDAATPSRGSIPARGRGRGVPWRARGTPSSAGRRPSTGDGSPRPRRELLEGLKRDPIHTFEPIDDPEGPDVQIEDVQQHGSYSWLEAKEPTIAVPGSPRIWLNRPLPFRVPKDTGRSFVDQNRFRLPAYPMLPLFAAVDTLEADPDHPKLSWDNVDFVSERNNLLKLLTFAEPKLRSLREREFRIDVELISPWTILMQRWEEAATHGSFGARYGDSFEAASTKPGPGCGTSSLVSHNRIISYDLAGLKMLIRFEVDACYSSESEPDADEPDLDALTAGLSSIYIGNSTAAAPPTSKIGPINVVRAGQVVPQEALIKVKTLAHTRLPYSWDAAYPQLLIGQTPTLKVGIHDYGTFEEIQERKLDSAEFDEVKTKVQPGLNKLRKLLGDIHDAALERGRGAMLSLVCQDGVLKLLERTDGRALLPPKVIRRFDPDADT